jgi:hypothetical protein
MTTQIVDRVKWYFGDKSTPKPAWHYPSDGWISDPEEIVRTIRLDDSLTIKKRK